MRTLVGVALVGLAVAGCTTYAWVKPGAGPMQLASDKLQCTERSLQAYPVLSSTQISYVNVTEKVVCRVAATDTKPAHDSVCEETRKVPQTKEVDLNETKRAGFERTCLESLGWSYVPVENS